jgi:hypothetical protein
MKRWIILGACLCLSLQACNSSSTTPAGIIQHQTLFVANSQTSGAVTMFQTPLSSSSTSNGALSGVANHPDGLCTGPAGQLVVTAGGAGFQTWLTPANGASPSFTNSPSSVISVDCAFDAAGDLYVVDEFGAILVFPAFHQGSSPGTSITTGINTPVSVATDPAGNLYVSNNHTLTIYNALGSGNTLQHTISGAGGSGIEFGPDGNIYIADFTTSGQVDVFVPPFLNTSVRDHHISPPGATTCHDVAFDRAGDLYVTCTNASVAGTGIYVYAPPYSGAPVELDTANAFGIAIL